MRYLYVLLARLDSLLSEVWPFCLMKTYFVGQGDNDEESDASEDDESMDDIEHDGLTGEDGILPSEVNFEKEAEVARKVLDNLIKASPSGVEPSPSEKSKLTESIEKLPSTHSTVNKESPRKKSGVIDSLDAKRSEQISDEFSKSRSDLDRTVFISNLPFEIDSDEVKQRFSVFGEVQAFVPVLHQLTKYVASILYFSTFF